MYFVGKWVLFFLKEIWILFCRFAFFLTFCLYMYIVFKLSYHKAMNSFY
jgi:hypothetical protein